MDEPRFVRLFEETLRQTWLKWCAGKVTTPPQSPPEPGGEAAVAGQFQQWLQERPQISPVEPQVFLAPGEGVSLEDARKLLSGAFEAAGVGEDKANWQEVVRLARLILESIPKEPISLAALAEAEYAHGNLQAAISYLSHAVDAAPQNIPFYQRLIHWQCEAGNEQAAQTVAQIMQQRGAGVV